MTPEEFLQKVKREHTKSHLKAVELFPTVVKTFEERLVEFNKDRSLEKPRVNFGSRGFGTDDPYTVMELTELLKQYFVAQGWLVSVQYPESYLFDVSTSFRLYTNTRKHRFYVVLQDIFNSSKSWDY